MYGATNTVIGGTTPEARNVISGNSWYGIELLLTTGAVIEGNCIGTNATGTAALGNFTDGVRVGLASDVTIGGTAPGAGNVISGNGTGHLCCGAPSPSGAGVGLTGVSATVVEGNLIGTDASGTYAIPNTGTGVNFFDNVTSTVIGGTTPAARNVISGNGSDGLGVGGAGDVILGNYIGTNAAGTAAVPLPSSSAQTRVHRPSRSVRSIGAAMAKTIVRGVDAVIARRTGAGQETHRPRSDAPCSGAVQAPDTLRKQTESGHLDRRTRCVQRRKGGVGRPGSPSTACACCTERSHS